MILSDYQQFGGNHPEIAGYKNILAYLEVKAPHTGKPFSEPMLLGIGGGLGAGYILWEFKKFKGPVVTLAYRNRWQYPMKYLTNLSDRLGATVAFQETAGKVKAETNLETALENGTPPMAWLDMGDDVTYHHHLAAVVVVYGIDKAKGEAYLDDRAARPFRLPLEVLREARARVPSYKNRLMLLEPPQEIPLREAVLAGLRDQLEHLSSPSDSFSLPTLRKWARLMTDPRNKKSWPNVFADQTGLYGALRSIYEGIELGGTGGGGMRGMYADFLVEAAPVVEIPALEKVAAHYQALAERWTELAEASLPANVPGFRETKSLLSQRHAILLEKGGDGLVEMQPLNERIIALQTEMNEAFPLDGKAASQLFEELQKLLYELYEQEKAALGELEAAL